MGAGAIAASKAGREADAEVAKASAAELTLALAELPQEDRDRLAAALEAIEISRSSQSVKASSSTAPVLATRAVDDGGAGAAMLDGDEELAFELNQQEILFQKCMRNRMEREAKKKREKQEKKEADLKKRRAAMEDAFDGEVDKLLSFFSEGFEIETHDDYGTTLLSEAAAGGSEDCIQVLLSSGANPNRRGRNRRTPLWRAANAGHSGAVQLLLRAGGDPRTPDEVGAKPYYVANGADVKELLECWDISVTETLQKAAGAAAKKMEEEQKAKETKQKVELDEALEESVRKAQIAKTEVARIQKLVVSYRQERVSLAEIGQTTKLEELSLLLEKAEGELQQAKIILQDLEWGVKRARLKVRDFENKLRRRTRKDGEAITLLEQVIFLKDTADVVIKDVGGKRREDGRWPLIFDHSGKTATFFRYNGSAVYTAEELTSNLLSSDKEEQRRLLVSLLKHLKYGGALIIILGPELEKMSVVEHAFNEIEKGLFGTLTDRSVLYSYLLQRRFLHLVPSDLSNDYSEYMFDDENLSKFVLAFIVTDNEPDQEVMEKECHMFYTIKVRDPEADDPDDP